MFIFAKNDINIDQVNVQNRVLSMPQCPSRSRPTVCPSSNSTPSIHVGLHQVGLRRQWASLLMTPYLNGPDPPFLLNAATTNWAGARCGQCESRLAGVSAFWLFSRCQTRSRNGLRGQRCGGVAVQSHESTGRHRCLVVDTTGRRRTQAMPDAVVGGARSNPRSGWPRLRSRGVAELR